MESHTDLANLSEDQLSQMAAQLITQLGDQQAQHAAELSQRDKTLQHYKIRNEQLTHELAILKRHRFGQRSEAGGSGQYHLLDEIVDEDLAAVESELALLTNAPRPARHHASRHGSVCPRSCPAQTSITTKSRPRAPAAAS